MLVKQLARASILSILLSMPLMAATIQKPKCQTQSGLTVKDQLDNSSFKISGLIKVDESLFFSPNSLNTQGQKLLPNGLRTNLRAAELTFSGDFNQLWAYKLGFSIVKSTIVKDAALTYKGFKNSSISAGQVTSAFGLENSSSSKWSAFLERSIAISTFERGYGYGLGLNYRYWSPQFVGIVSAIQPKDNAVVDKLNPTLPNRHSDKWSVSTRLVYLPINTDQSVMHLGVSGAEQRLETLNYNGDPLKSFSLAVPLEGQGRQSVSIVKTPALQSPKFRLLGVEAALMQGPFFAKFEGLKNQVRRVNDSNLNFYSWTAKARYLLSGENFKYDGQNASLAQVKPKSNKGALELALRISSVSLNSKDVFGGRQQNIGIALNWYLDNNVKISSNVVNAHIRAANNQPAKSVNIAGLRLQYIW